MNRQRFLPHALFLLTLARLAMLATTDLSPIEADAARCAEHPDLWHPHTGPVLPLLMRSSAAVLGLNSLGIRFFAPFLILGAGWIVGRLAAAHHDPVTAAWAVVIFHVTPAVNLASVTFTNTTLAIAESAALLALLRLALHRPLRTQLHWWGVAALGAAAFATDWPLVVFAAASAASLLLTRRGRAAILKWPVLPILAGTMLLVLAAFVTWNIRNHWSAFQARPGGHSLWRNLFLAYGPLLPLHAWCLVEPARRRPLAYASASLMAFAWPLCALDLYALGSIGWPQAGFGAWVPAASILSAAWLMQSGSIPFHFKVWVRSVAVIAAAALSCIVCGSSARSIPHASQLRQTAAPDAPAGGPARRAAEGFAAEGFACPPPATADKSPSAEPG